MTSFNSEKASEKKIGFLQIAFFMLAFLSLFSHSANATTYFVDQANGSSGNPGTEARPFQDISQAASRMRAGDTCLVKNGTYNGGSTIGAYEPANSGTEYERIIFRAFPGHRPQLKGTIGATHPRNYITWDGFLLDGTFAIYGGGDTAKAKGWQLINNEIKNGSYANDGNWTGIFIQAADNLLIANNDIHDIKSTWNGSPRGIGVLLFDCTDCVIENNFIHDNFFEGGSDKQGGVRTVWRKNIFKNIPNTILRINNQGGNNNTSIYENAFICPSTTQDFAIDLRWKTQNAKIYNNVFYGCHGISSFAGVLGEVNSNFSIYNNIFYNAGSAQVMAYAFDRWNSNEPQFSNYNLFYNVRLEENRYSNPLAIPALGDDLGRMHSGLSSWRSAHVIYDQNSLDSDPKFTNVGNFDFRLRSDSPAKGAGRNGTDIGLYPNPGNSRIGLLESPIVNPQPPSNARARQIN